MMEIDWELQTDGTYIDSYGSRFDSDGGSIPFTKKNIEHPGDVRKRESLKQYHVRIDVACELGFHLGDLSWDQWSNYCEGSKS